MVESGAMGRRCDEDVCVVCERVCECVSEWCCAVERDASEAVRRSSWGHTSRSNSLSDNMEAVSSSTAVSLSVMTSE